MDTEREVTEWRELAERLAGIRSAYRKAERDAAIEAERNVEEWRRLQRRMDALRIEAEVAAGLRKGDA